MSYLEQLAVNTTQLHSAGAVFFCSDFTWEDTRFRRVFVGCPIRSQIEYRYPLLRSYACLRSYLGDLKQRRVLSVTYVMENDIRVEFGKLYTWVLDATV